MPQLVITPPSCHSLSFTTSFTHAWQKLPCHIIRCAPSSDRRLFLRKVTYLVPGEVRTPSTAAARTDPSDEQRLGDTERQDQRRTCPIASSAPVGTNGAAKETQGGAAAYDTARGGRTAAREPGTGCFCSELKPAHFSTITNMLRLERLCIVNDNRRPDLLKCFTCRRDITFYCLLEELQVTSGSCAVRHAHMESVSPSTAE